jgi:hypothetical protein
VQELTFTAALWRESGVDVEKYAEAMRNASGRGGGKAPSLQAVSVKKAGLALTPHVAVAAKTLVRFPLRRFVLGERIPYLFVCRDPSQASSSLQVVVVVASSR